MNCDLKRIDGETQDQYFYRICNMKDSLGFTWPQMAEIFNKEFGCEKGDTAYRKRWNSFKSLLDANTDKFVGDNALLKELKDQEDRIYKAKRQLYDQRREYHKLLVSDARAEHLAEEMIAAAARLNTEKILDHNEEFYSAADNDAVLILSDWHFGMVTDNIWNKFNVDVCIERVAKLLERSSKYLRLHDVNNLHIVLNGDMVAGAIHTTVRVASEENTCDQLMKVSELLAELVSELSNYVNNVYVHSTYGNHARTIQNKNDSIHSDNMEKIIPWWLKQRLSANNKVHIIDSRFYEFIYINVLGHDVIAVHGDLENFKKLGTDMHTLFAKKYGLDVEYVFSGDKHHIESNDAYGIDNVMISSLCGTDEYANNKRLYSKPAQTLCIFNAKDGKVCTYNITF